MKNIKFLQNYASQNVNIAEHEFVHKFRRDIQVVSP